METQPKFEIHLRNHCFYFLDLIEMHQSVAQKLASVNNQTIKFKTSKSKKNKHPKLPVV